MALDAGINALATYKKQIAVSLLESLKPNLTMGIEIKDGRIYVEGRETVNPELIGWAIIDAAENGEIEIIDKITEDEKV